VQILPQTRRFVVTRVLQHPCRNDSTAPHCGIVVEIWTFAMNRLIEKVVERQKIQNPSKIIDTFRKNVGFRKLKS
jgi:hypothetical protein